MSGFASLKGEVITSTQPNPAAVAAPPLPVWGSLDHPPREPPADDGAGNRRYPQGPNAPKHKATAADEEPPPKHAPAPRGEGFGARQHRTGPAPVTLGQESPQPPPPRLSAQCMSGSRPSPPPHHRPPRPCTRGTRTEGGGENPTRRSRAAASQSTGRVSTETPHTHRYRRKPAMSFRVRRSGSE